MTCHDIENDIKFNGEVSNKNITHFLKQYYDLTSVTLEKHFDYFVLTFF